MDEKSLNMIKHLRSDARMPLTKMSRKTGIPISTLFDKLKNAENDAIIRHTSIIDFPKVGFDTVATIIIKVDSEDRERLQSYLLKQDMLNNVFRINDSYDFMIEGVFRKVKDLELFLDLLDAKFNILYTKYYLLIEDLKREGFMSDS